MIEITTHSLLEPGDLAAPPLDHKHNLNVGSARLIWADACTPFGKPQSPAGWVLPGGDRTIDRNKALRVVKNMDRLMSAH